MNDFELVRCYAEERSEAAFAELVKRYIDFVYSAAFRQVGGDAHLAEDVTQSVFVDLARKVGSRARTGVFPYARICPRSRCRILILMAHGAAGAG